MCFSVCPFVRLFVSLSFYKMVNMEIHVERGMPQSELQVLSCFLVTQFSVGAWSIFLGTTVALYTAIGGLGGVIWTDVFQALIMYSGLIAVMIKGFQEVGGISEMFKLNSDGDHLKFAK